MHIESYELGAFATNCYLAWQDPAHAVVIDPSGEPERLIAAIKEHGLTPRAVLLTHAHIDHILALPDVIEEWDIPTVMHPKEEELYRAPQHKLIPFLPRLEKPLPDTVSALDEPVSGLAYTELFVPGHTVGHIAFYYPEEKVLFGGDVLFRGSVGRTDFPGGDWATLEASIRNELYTLPDDTTVYPGHGPPTTIGHEKQHNPFVPAK